MNGTQLRNSILQWAIQGKLVPQDPNDEPASVLLERIREEKARLVKEKKIKRDKNESIIYRGDDNSYYEKFTATGEVKCIDDEIPFDLPNTWCWVRLDNVITLLSGRDLEPSQYNILEKGIPYMTGASNFLNDELIVNRWTLSPTTISHKGELLITCKGTIGTMAFNVIGDIHIARQIMSISSNYINLNYLKLYLEVYVSELEKVARSIIPGISRNDILKAVFPVPPLNEQAKIVEFINCISPSISLFGKKQYELMKLNENIKPTLKKSILQEAIQGRLVAHCDTEEPASILLERIRAEKQKLVKEGKIKKSALEDTVIFKGDDNKYWEKRGKEIVCIDDEIPFNIPDSWTWCRIKDIFLINPKNNAQDDIDAAFIPMEKIDATYLSSFTYSTKKWGEIKKGFTHFADGDVAFAKITPCFQNRKSMILRDLPNCIGAGTTELKVLRSYGTTIINEYLLFFLESSYFVDEATFKGTANQQRIISGYLENKLFPLPPLQEQQRIVDAVLSTWQVL